MLLVETNGSSSVELIRFRLIRSSTPLDVVTTGGIRRGGGSVHILVRVRFSASEPVFEREEEVEESDWIVFVRGLAGGCETTQELRGKAGGFVVRVSAGPESGCVEGEFEGVAFGFRVALGVVGRLGEWSD